MGDYAFDKQIIVGYYEVKVDTSAMCGYFEHEIYGDELGGGLWFEQTDAGIALIDQDGTPWLPRSVAKGLREMGFIVDKDFENEPPSE